MAAKKKTSVVEKQKSRDKEIPAYKLRLVSEIAAQIKSHRTFLIASTKGLPSSQFHEIKKNLRSKSEVKVAKKNLVLRAIDEIKSSALDSMKSQIGANVAMFFSNEEPFELSGILADNQSPTKARAGELAPEDIKVEPGPTDLVPGPAISELSAVGLKVAVEGGKLAVKLPHVIVKQGEVIKENVASVMAKLNIAPMKVGFEPIAAYDKQEDKVYVGIRIDKKQAFEDLREAIGKGFGFAVNISYPTNETIKYLISKAGLQEKAIDAIINKTSTQTSQENNRTTRRIKMEYIYGALLLHKLGQPVNAESLTKVISAAGVSVDESKVKTLIAALQGVDIAAELANASTMAAAPAASATPAAKEEKKEEKASESAAGLSALFG